MDIRKINDQISVAPQITAEDISDIAAAGFRSIICNRPDGEAPDQPDFADIEAAAKAAGLQTLLLPIVGGMISAEQVEAFGTALREMPGPVLAYCRSGTRSTMLWSLSQAGHLAPEEILSATAAAGYDMSAVVQQIAQSTR